MTKKKTDNGNRSVEVFNGGAGFLLADIPEKVLAEIDARTLAKLTFGWTLIEYHHDEHAAILRDKNGFLLYRVMECALHEKDMDC